MIAWIEAFCTHPVGDLAGQPLVLPEWFKRDVLTPLFGWKRANGTRRYTRVYCEVPRGNAKSTLSTAVSLYCLCADGQRTPRVFCAAGSKDQASLVFDPAKIMVRQNEDLNDQLKIYQNSIMDPVGGGVMKVVSADGDLQQGLNGTMVSFDELHVQPNSKLYDAFNNMFVKRQEPLMLMLTTAGVVGSFAHTVHDYAVQVRDGIVKDDRFLAVIYSADDDSDDFDEKQWVKANPGWSYLNQTEFKANAEKAKNSAVERLAFRRFHLNKWTGTETVWLDDDSFMRGLGSGFTDDEMIGRECYVGLDLSHNRDTTAAVYLFPPREPEERWKVIPRVFIPADTLDRRAERETVLYREWADSGAVILTPGETQNHEMIFDDLMAMSERYNIRCVAYDRWGAGYIAGRLDKAGIDHMAYKQNAEWMNHPMQMLETMLLEGKFDHRAHPVLRWQCSCLSAKMYTIGGAEYMMPTKKKDGTQRIDAMVAWIVALGAFKILNVKYEPPKPEGVGVFIIKRKP